jgi:hypothetical protein
LSEHVHGLDPEVEEGRGEALGTRCRCGNIIEFDFDYLDPVELWAQPNVANRMREIDGYAVRVEGLTYSKSR